MLVRLLGPLVVGGTDRIPRRDRIVLSALSLSPGEAVSADRLADALWGADPPPSWPKVVQGAVVRLRRLLGAAAIETVPAGYRLTLGGGDLDLAEFERLVGRGRRFRSTDEPDRAATAFAEGLDLWRGAPLPDLEAWPPGRTEAARLDELRRTSEEQLLECQLALGQHREVIAQAERLTAQEPLRERRWATLALAYYRSGRQADALRAIAHARSVLAEQLGLDPGTELIELEVAMLQQDPALVPPRMEAVDAGVGRCPYRGLQPYDLEHAGDFFGRAQEVGLALTKLLEVGFLALVGASGSGKSSLLRAGVAARLAETGRGVARCTPGSDPMSTLAVTLATCAPGSVLVVDQLEQLFTLPTAEAVRQQFLETIVAHHASGGMVAVALRVDQAGEVAEVPTFARLLEKGLHLITPMTPVDLRDAIESPAHQCGLRVEPGLTDLLIAEVGQQPGNLPLLSHALMQTWDHREGRVLTLDGYHATGGIQQALARTAERLHEQLTPQQRRASRSILLRLVAISDSGEPSSTPVARRVLTLDGDHEQVIDQFMEARLLTVDEHTVRVAHEALARSWPRLRGWLDADLEGQRLLRHVATSAAEWRAMDCAPTELYRGSRLDDALRWVEEDAPALTDEERDFLEAGRSARDEQEQQAEARRREREQAHRRLRVSLVVIGAALVLTLVAGAVAVSQRNRADHVRNQAVVAGHAAKIRALVSRSVALQSTQRDTAALLAIAAYRLAPGPATEDALFGSLTTEPAVRGSVRITDTPSLIGATFLPDDRTVVVADALGRIRFVDFASGRDTAAPIPAPPAPNADMAMAVSADGSTLARVWLVGDPTAPQAANWHSDFDVWDLRSHRIRTRPVDIGFGSLSVALASDGSLLAVGGAPDSRVVVYGRDGKPRRRIPGRPRPAGASNLARTASVLFDAHDNLFIGSVAGLVRLVDPSTGRELRRVDPGHQVSNSDMHLANGGATLLMNGNEGFARWDLDQSTVDWTVGDNGSCISIAVSTSTHSVYCDGYDHISVYDIANGVPTGVPPAFQGTTRGVLTSGDGRRLVLVGDAAPVIETWDLGDLGLIRRPVAKGYRASGYSPDGRRLLVRRASGRPPPLEDDWELWDPATDTSLAHLDHVAAAAFVDDDHLVALFDDGTASLYDLRMEARTGTSVRRPDGTTLLVAVDPGSRRLAITVGFPERPGVKTFHLGDFREMPPTVPLQEVPESMSFSPDGRTLVISSFASGTVAFDSRTSQRLAGPVAGLSYSKVSSRGVLAASEAGARIRFLDARTLEPRGPSVDTRVSGSRGLQFSGNGSRLVASNNFQATLIDVAGRAEIGSPIPTSTGDVALRDDGKELAVTVGDGVVLWDLDVHHWLVAACRLAGRNLTRDQWSTEVGDLAPYARLCPAYPAA